MTRAVPPARQRIRTTVEAAGDGGAEAVLEGRGGDREAGRNLDAKPGIHGAGRTQVRQREGDRGAVARGESEGLGGGGDHEVRALRGNQLQGGGIVAAQGVVGSGHPQLRGGVAGGGGEQSQRHSGLVARGDVAQRAVDDIAGVAAARSGSVGAEQGHRLRQDNPQIDYINGHITERLDRDCYICGPIERQAEVLRGLDGGICRVDRHEAARPRLTRCDRRRHDPEAAVREGAAAIELRCHQVAAGRNLAGRTGFHVMRRAEYVADLMRHDQGREAGVAAGLRKAGAERIAAQGIEVRDAHRATVEVAAGEQVGEARIALQGGARAVILQLLEQRAADPGAGEGIAARIEEGDAARLQPHAHLVGEDAIDDVQLRQHVGFGFDAILAREIGIGQQRHREPAGGQQRQRVVGGGEFHAQLLHEALGILAGGAGVAREIHVFPDGVAEAIDQSAVRRGACGIDADGCQGFAGSHTVIVLAVEPDSGPAAAGMGQCGPGSGYSRDLAFVGRGAVAQPAGEFAQMFLGAQLQLLLCAVVIQLQPQLILLQHRGSKLCAVGAQQAQLGSGSRCGSQYRETENEAGQSANCAVRTSIARVPVRHAPKQCVVMGPSLREGCGNMGLAL